MRFDNCVLIRGGGDLASGVALRLHRSGIRVLITELPQPLAVRRGVSFAEAVFEGSHQVEEVHAKFVEVNQLEAWEEADVIPLIVDPEVSVLSKYHFPVVVDARLLKTSPHPLPTRIPLHIGLGPGFTAGSDCHAVIETRRSHTLGHVYWKGTTQPDTGEPEGDPRRVLRSPMEGTLISHAQIGEHLPEGQLIAEIRLGAGNQNCEITSPFDGVLRGLIRDGSRVKKDMKIGDVDSRDDPSTCFLVSDKALAIGGGVLEAIFSKTEIRKKIYSE